MKTAGKWLTWTGLAIAIVTVIAGVVMAVIGFGKLAEVVDDSFRVTGPTSHTAQADEVLVLYSPRDSATAVPVCAITGPAPTQPGPRQPSGDFTYDSSTIAPFASYRFTQAGQYTIDCDRSGVVAGPELPVAGIFTGAGGILLAVFGGLGGAALLVLGVILWVVGANRTRTPPAPPAYPYGAPYGGQPYQPGAPQQPYQQPYQPGTPQQPGTPPSYPPTPTPPPADDQR